MAKLSGRHCHVTAATSHASPVSFLPFEMLQASSSSHYLVLCAWARNLPHRLYMINVKKLKSLKQCLTATGPTSRNQNSKNQKGAITLAARRHNTTFLIFAVLVA